MSVTRIQRCLICQVLENRLTINTIGRFLNRDRDRRSLGKFKLPPEDEEYTRQRHNFDLQKANFEPLKELLQWFLTCTKCGTLLKRHRL